MALVTRHKAHDTKHATPNAPRFVPLCMLTSEPSECVSVSSPFLSLEHVAGVGQLLVVEARRVIDLDRDALGYPLEDVTLDALDHGAPLVPEPARQSHDDGGTIQLHKLNRLQVCVRGVQTGSRCMQPRCEVGGGLETPAPHARDPDLLRLIVAAEQGAELGLALCKNTLHILLSQQEVHLHTHAQPSGLTPRKQRTAAPAGQQAAWCVRQLQRGRAAEQEEDHVVLKRPACRHQAMFSGVGEPLSLFLPSFFSTVGTAGR